MLSCIPEGEERSPALRGRRLTRAVERLYMLLYLGGGIQRVERFLRAYVCNKLRRMSRRVSFDSRRRHQISPMCRVAQKKG